VDKCRDTLERAESGDVCVFTSALTIAECLWLRGSPQIPKNRAEIVRRFFRHSYIRVRNVTRKTSELAQDLVWDHSCASGSIAAGEAEPRLINSGPFPLIGQHSVEPLSPKKRFY